MPIPDFQSIMLPLLKFASDGEEHSLSDARAPLANQFELNDDERLELLPSGQQSRFNNRVAWAKIYLERAGIFEKTRRGYFKITPRGLDVLASCPVRIDIAFLKQFSEFDDFRNRQSKNTDAESVDDETPEETFQSAYETIRDTLGYGAIDIDQIVVTLVLRTSGFGSHVEDGLRRLSRQSRGAYECRGRRGY
jgi:restriction system protein